MIPLFNINDYTVDTSSFSHALHGSVVEDLEKTIADYVGAKYACSVSSATNAIFLSFVDKNPFVEMIPCRTVSIPSMIPPVVLNAVINSGYEVEFVDNTEWVGDSYILHDFGSYKIIDSAQKIVEDQFKQEANPDDLMFFSFYPTKPVGGLDGGMIVSDDSEKIQWFREAVMNGMSSELNNWERKIKFAGWKMYMNSFQAHVALQNFHKLEEKKKRLKEVREYYNEELELNNTSEHLYRINVSDRDSVMSKLRGLGISCGIHYSAMHLHPTYNGLGLLDLAPDVRVEYPEDLGLTKTERATRTTLSIPYHEKLTDDEVVRVKESLK
tara:strand:+ start:32 stop:1009 length:978 start_codon:yes stop_codon:yes gene_type:complete